ncbi:MAG: GatB/YqeY domain-containing protein, partial [Anaerolineaceae bacterium]|nr:GatB/YqeY domain-containing protein [Anaerolineaceae bacterium]
MTLREDISLAIQNAMRSKDETRLRVLRLLLSAIKLADAEKGVAVDDAAILTLVQKEIKIRKDSIEGAEAAGRP